MNTTVNAGLQVVRKEESQEPALPQEPQDTPQVLLEHYLKVLRLPSFGREYDKVAVQCAREGVDHPRYLLRLCELEVLDRERKAMERRIRQARFPVLKSLDSFDFLALPSLNKALVLELARCEYIERKENVLALGNSGTGKTHIALGLGLAACQKGYAVRFTTAASLVRELIEAKDEKRLLRYQQQLASALLLIVDELGFVPLSRSGAELLFEVLSQRYERSATFITSNLPFNEWTEILGSERLTGALLDRLTHHVHILEMNGPSYRLQHSQAQQQVQQKVKGQKHLPVQHREDTEEGDNSAAVREPVEMSSG
jgi:DNA replication protein DnaC